MRYEFLAGCEPIKKIEDAYYFRHNIEASENNSHFVEADEEVVIVPNATYSTLVSALIHTKYSVDDELAILANHAADPTNAEHLATYNEYQSWRAEVKAACKEYFGTE